MIARHGDVVARGEVGQQVEFLEHEPHGAFAQARAAAIGERGQVLIGHAHLSRKWVASGRR